MSIQTTYPMDRETAIERISTLYALIQEKDFKAIEDMIFETNYNIEAFVFNFEEDEDNIERFEYINKWTNDMVADQINKPFFRRSLFENYYIEEKEV